MMIYDDLWWFMMIYQMIYDDLPIKFPYNHHKMMNSAGLPGDRESWQWTEFTAAATLALQRPLPRPVAVRPGSPRNMVI